MGKNGKQNNSATSAKKIQQNGKIKLTPGVNDSRRYNATSAKTESKKVDTATSSWLSNLVTQCITNETSGGLNKLQRIEKRKQKRLKRIAEYSSKQKNFLTSKNHVEMQQNKALGYSKDKKTASAAVNDSEATKMHVYNSHRLHQYNILLSSIVQRSAQHDDNDQTAAKERKDKHQQDLHQKKGKAVAGPIMPDSLLQPRKREYGGLGLARPSLYLDLRDESFIPKLEEEFSEHITGFYGKIRTKAMKKQAEGNMLWRQLLKQKESGGIKPVNVVKNGKMISGIDFSKMTPDQKVEMMIKTGAI